MTGRTALITGATGAVGPTLTRHLLAAGWRVRALVRRPELADLPPETEIFPGDVTRPESLMAAAIGCEAVLHLAARLHIPQPDPRLAAAYQEVNVAGTAHVAAAARVRQVPRLIFFSTINVYGPSPGPTPLDENSPLHPQTLYARTKAQAEVIALETPAPDGGPAATVLRLAAVYGPGMKGNYPRLVQAIAGGYYLPIGNGQNRRTLVFVDDVAAAVLRILDDDRARGQIYNVTDGRVYTMREIEEAIYAGLKKRPPPLAIPAPVARAGAELFASGWSLLARRPPPLNRAAIETLLEDVAVSGQKLLDELNFKPEVSLSAGWQAVAAAHIR